MLRIGSMFSGSGGFELAGALNGVEPVWCSEIEPYPIAVTRSRFPNMKHYGDVSKVNGAEVEPVDIITFGSPCQDLSIAGKREGIEDGARSSLFFQAVRIIKEMREETNGAYPRFAVWENVPGAFSSNKGNDFRLVLEALASISDPTVSIPMPEKWQRAGEIVGDGYSIAWRIFDAQHWGVPQRRKRIYLVADFGSERAGQILVERESVCGNPAQSREAGEGTAEDSERSVRGSSNVQCLNPWDTQTARIYDTRGSFATLQAGENSGLQRYGVVYPQIARTLEARHDSSPCIDRGQNIVCIHDKAARYQGGGDTRDNDGSGNGLGVSEDGVEYTLTAADRHGVAYSVDCRNMCLNEELSGTLQAKENGGQSLNYQAPVVYSRQRSDELVENTVASCQSARQYKDNTDLVVVGSKPPRKYIVRRLTPTECARLQGFPDNWGELAPYDGDDAFWQSVYKTACEIKGGKYTPKKDLRKWYDGLHTDSAEYKMWGNGIALPCAEYVISSITRGAQ